MPKMLTVQLRARVVQAHYKIHSAQPSQNSVLWLWVHWFAVLFGVKWAKKVNISHCLSLPYLVLDCMAYSAQLHEQIGSWKAVLWEMLLVKVMQTQFLALLRLGESPLEKVDLCEWQLNERPFLYELVFNGN